MLLHYHIGRLVLSSLYVGDLVRLVLSSVRVAINIRFTVWNPEVFLRTGNSEKPSNLAVVVA